MRVYIVLFVCHKFATFGLLGVSDYSVCDKHLYVNIIIKISFVLLTPPPSMVDCVDEPSQFSPFFVFS